MMPGRRRWPLILGAVLLALAVAALALGRGPPQPLQASSGPMLRATLVARLKPSSAPVRGLAFAPDGRLIIAHADGSLFSRGKTGAIGQISSGPPIAAMRLSPDANQLALGGYDGSVRLVGLDGRGGRTLATQGAATWSLAFAPTGEQIAAGSEDGRIRWFNLATGAAQTVQAHRLNVWSLDFDRRSGLLASGSFDRQIRLWDMGSAKPRPATAGHDQAVVSLAFAPDGRSIASGGDDAKLRLWDEGMRPTWARNAGQHLYAVAFTPDGRWIVSGGRESSGLQALFRQVLGVRIGGGNGTTLRIWRVPDGALVESVGVQPSDVTALSFAAGGRLLASGADDGSVAFWRLDATPALTSRRQGTTSP